MNLTAMRKLEGWSDLAESELRNLSNYGVERWFRAGTALQEPGTVLPGLALVTQGEVQSLFLVKDLALKVELLGPGRWLGSEAWTEGASSLLSLRALSDVRIIMVALDQLERLRTNPTPLALRLFRSLAVSTAQTEGRLGSLSAHATALQQTAPKLGRHELMSLGFAKLAIGVQTSLVAGDRNGVELVQRDGVAITANFRPLR